MNILIYVPTIMVDDNAGNSIHINELAENLSKLGNKVTIICRLRSNVYSGLATIKRVVAPDIKVIGWLLATIYGLFLGLITTRREKHDIVYTRAGLSASAYLISCLAKVPCVTEVNGFIGDEARVSGIGLWRKILNYLLDWIERKAYRRSQHLVAVTPKIREALAAGCGIEPDKITVIPNGANTDLFKPMDTNQARKELNLGGGDYFVTFAGGLFVWQGVENLIRSVPYVLKKCPETKFLIVGDGLMRRELVELAQQIGVSDRIIFIGNVPYREVPLYINASDVCVAPFIRERNEKGGLSPLKIYEYMACGKPIVASRIVNLEFIEQSNAGILVEAENPQELANDITRLLEDEGIRQQMGENGRKYVVKNHSWGNVARRVVKLCGETIKEYKALK